MNCSSFCRARQAGGHAGHDPVAVGRDGGMLGDGGGQQPLLAPLQPPVQVRLEPDDLHLHHPAAGQLTADLVRGPREHQLEAVGLGKSSQPRRLGERMLGPEPEPEAESARRRHRSQPPSA